MPRDATCKRCPLHAATKHVCLWGEGPKRAKIMLIGEAPGDNEERQGRPFVGAAGHLIDELLGEAGLRREDVYVTNANKCRPPGNRTPTQQELAACLPFLAQELVSVQPEVIVCVGGSALKAVTGISAVGSSRGRILASAKLRTNAKILVTYHPAAMLHDPRRRTTMRAQIVEDFKLAASLAGASSSLPQEVRTLVHAGERDKLIKALASIAEAKVLVADCEWLASHETDALIWPWDKRAGFLSLAFSAVLADGKVHSVGIEWDPNYFKPLQAFMRKRAFVFHNAMADLIWLYDLGFQFELRGDTLIRAYLLDEEQRLALDQLAPLLAGVEPGWKKPVWRDRPVGKQVDDLLNYNCDDTYATLCLDNALSRRIRALSSEERGNIQRAYKKLLLPAVSVFARIAIAGVGVNIAELEKTIEWRREELERATRQVASLADVPMNMAAKIAGSPQQTARFLSNSWGVELDNSTKQELGKYVEQYEIVKAIRDFRHERKLLGTYLEPWRRLIEKQRDERLHSIYRLASSRTGRTSAELAEGGSLQLAPREEWLRQLIVALQKARDEEEPEAWYVLAADYSQIELRVIAWLAPEPTMRRLFKEGADLHTTTAARLARVAYEDVTKEQRQRAKGVNFGFCYGMQPEKFSDYARENYGVEFSAREAVAAHTAYFELYPGLAEWHNRATAVDFQRQLTVTPTGRYRRNFKSPTEAINTPIQTTASDLTLFAMTSIDEKIAANGLREAAFLTGFVHDSVLLEVRRDVADEVKAIVKDTMEHPDLERIGIADIPVPLVADVKIGANWGDAS